MIQNLLFDLGGVIMDIKKDNCVQALRLIGFKNPEEYLGEYSQKGPFGQLEQGLISPDEFRAFIRSRIEVPVTDEQIDNAFNKFLTGIPVERLRRLQQLRRRYGIYLLSNTNPIMWNSRIASEFRKDGLEVEAYFDGIVTSFEAKLLKPDVKIFEYAASHCDIVPGETLFLYDSLHNLTGAEEAGFRTAHVPEGMEFYKVLADLDLA